MDPKVYLSPIEESHLFHYMSLSDAPELITTMGWRPFESNEKERFLNAVEVLTLPYCGDGQPITFSIITTEENLPIGYVTLKGINHDKATVELGIAVMDSRYLSGGYGSDALTVATDYAFNHLQLSTIGLTVFPSNVRAIKAYEKVGFKVVDVLEKAWTMPGGKKVDMLLMELKREIVKSDQVVPVPAESLIKRPE
jgi:RimJ/RimL family protein N-acetyltransferase